MPNDASEPGAELELLELFARRAGVPRAGETWSGDDAAVLVVSDSRVLFASDALVEHVHFERSTHRPADIGWKALAVNLSDIAAMGGEPLACVASVAGATRTELEELHAGLLEAAAAFDCPLVGGDLADGRELVVVVAILGTANDREPVLRSGARAGETIFVTGPLGASAAGLRALAQDSNASGPNVAAHRRPVPRIAEGKAAARAGASAMLDVSDGLGLDLDRLARASGVGLSLEAVPVVLGASAAEALGGGEDYELVFSAPNAAEVERSFTEAGLALPRRIGRIEEDPSLRLLDGEPFAPAGYVHRLD